MNQAKDITNVLWVYLASDKRQVAKKVLDKLNEDIASFVLYDGYYIAIESHSQYTTIPDYLYNFIKDNESDIIDFNRYLEEHAKDEVTIA